MTQTVIYSLASAPLPTGVTSIPATAVTGFTNGLDCLIGQAVGPNALTWANAATSVTIATELSYDGGATWVAGAGSGHQGAPGSKLATVTSFGFLNSCVLDGNSNPLIPTHIRGTITVTNGPLSLGMTITAH